MAVSVVQMTLVVDPDDPTKLSPTPTLTLPNQPGPIMVLFTISGGTFSTSSGIQVTSSPPGSINTPPQGDATLWWMRILNDSRSTAGTIDYQATFTPTQLELAGQFFTDDPTIDNQPPTG